MDTVTASLAHHVYLARCGDGSLYTGYAVDVGRRIAAHNAGTGGRYTRSHRPVTLIATWDFATKGEALRAEHALKKLRPAQKLAAARAACDQKADSTVPTRTAISDAHPDPATPSIQGLPDRTGGLDGGNRTANESGR